MISHDFQIFGVRIVMRIAQRVNIALRPTDGSNGFVQNLNAFGRVNETLGPRLNIGVAASRYHQRQPASVQFQSHRHKHIGVLNSFHQAGLGGYEMRVFVTFAQTDGGDMLAAHKFRHRSQIRQRSGYF